jgi:hypothetical protein
MMTWHDIYEEKDKTSFMGMKPVQLVSIDLEIVWNYHSEWFRFIADFLLII